MNFDLIAIMKATFYKMARAQGTRRYVLFGCLRLTNLLLRSSFELLPYCYITLTNLPLLQGHTPSARWINLHSRLFARRTRLNLSLTVYNMGARIARIRYFLDYFRNALPSRTLHSTVAISLSFLNYSNVIN